MAKEHKFFTNVSEFDFTDETKKLVESLNRLKAMSVQEFTFYKKWEELRQYNDGRIACNSEDTEKRIWRITDPNDEESTIKQIEDLEPELIFVKDTDEKYYEVWNHLRLFCHTMEFNQNPGRFLRFLAIDKKTSKYLGAMSVASDVIVITDRDKYIGWSSDNRLKDKMLAHSAIGSCIMATQPFGYNFLGGKLMACLVTSKIIQDIWKELYGQTLVGMTTTSLYGSFSMYNNIPWWHKCGTSAGKILIKPDQSCYDTWHNYLQTDPNHKEAYIKAMTQKEGVNGPVTAAKLRVLSMVMNACEIKQKEYVHGYERGVYYSCFYNNTKEFLQNKITDKDLIIKPNRDMKAIMEWWKPKAINRYRKLFSENNVRNETLFYLPMSQMTYEKAKAKYFANVGEGK
jgi:hypothetical protein